MFCWGFALAFPCKLIPKLRGCLCPGGLCPHQGACATQKCPSASVGRYPTVMPQGQPAALLGRGCKHFFVSFISPPHFLPLGNFRLNGGRFYRRRDVLQQGEEKEKRARCVQGTSPPRCLGQDRGSVAMGSRGCREPGAGRHRGLLAGRILPTAPQPGEPRDCAEPGRLRVTAKATSPRSAGRCRGDP